MRCTTTATASTSATSATFRHRRQTQTLIYSGRPLRCRNTPYVQSWNEGRAAEIAELTGKGIVPFVHEFQQAKAKGDDDFDVSAAFPLLMGQIAGGWGG